MTVSLFLRRPLQDGSKTTLPGPAQLILASLSERTSASYRLSFKEMPLGAIAEKEGTEGAPPWPLPCVLSVGGWHTESSNLIGGQEMR